MRSLWIAVCLFLVAVVAFGQGDRGTITGTISDQQGAVIANATVEARNRQLYVCRAALRPV
jgi:hypothetical protein